MDIKILQKFDPEIAELVKKEVRRQQDTIDLIPSENICPPVILEILGSPLVNKYSEGYPGKRYYPGCEYYDEIENLAIARALKAFNLNPDDWHVNVQALSGAPANTAVYFGLLELGDTLLGMRLDAGGHLTHGHKVSFSGKAYRAAQYGVNVETEQIDYENVGRLAQEHKPKVIVSGTTAYPRALDFKKFREVADAVGAYHVADVSHVGGLIVGGAYPSPFEYSDVVTMTTHKTLRGPRGAVIFVNKKSRLARENGVDIATAVDRAVFPGLQGGPHNNQTAGIAVMFYLAQQPEYKEYQKQIVKNASVLASAFRELGYNLFAGGTDCHMMLVKLASKGIAGSEAEKLLQDAGIIANRNSIPGDPSPLRPSGIRMGTPSITARGMKEEEMKKIALLVDRTWRKENMGVVQKEVHRLTEKYKIQ